MAVHTGDRAHWEKIAFIAGLSERHYPNYALFCETISKPEQATQLRKVLNKVWEYLAGQLNSMKNLEKALLDVESLTPEPQEDDGYGIYPALDFCLLLTSGLQMILDNSIDDTDTAAGLSRETVSQFIALSEGLEYFDPENQQHDLYDQELAYQQWLRECLAEQRPANVIVKELRRELSQLPASNLGIEI